MQRGRNRPQRSNDRASYQGRPGRLQVVDEAVNAEKKKLQGARKRKSPIDEFYGGETTDLINPSGY